MPTLIRNGSLEIEFDYTFEDGSADYFDQAWGNWLPGDPEVLEISDARTREGTPVELTPNEEEEAREIAWQAIKAAREDAAIDRYESAMDRDR